MNQANPCDPAFWDRTAESYAAMAAPFTGLFAEDALDTLFLASGVRFLDVATGTGVAALAAARRGAAVTAIDFSQGMIDRLSMDGGASVDARVMDGQNLTFESGSFDAAASIFGVMLFPDWHTGLREMARVVRSGGEVAIAVWKNPMGAGAQAVLAEICSTLYPDVTITMPSGGMAALCEPAALARAMSEAGFESVRISESTHDFVFRIDALDDGARNLAAVPAWAALDEKQRSVLLSAARERAVRDSKAGLWPIPSTALVAKAIRT